MSDPAREAAQRVWSPDWSYIDAEGKLTEAAREALAPIKKRHTPTSNNIWCIHCEHAWPCPDALDAYPESEL